MTAFVTAYKIAEALPLLALFTTGRPFAIAARGRDHDHTYVVRVLVDRVKGGEIVRKPFDKRRSDPIGTAGYGATTEIVGLTAVVDGHDWVVPKRLWRDVYNPFAEDALTKGALEATLSANRKRLFVCLYGSDGAGSFEMHWFLVRDGHSYRRWSWALDSL